MSLITFSNTHPVFIKNNNSLIIQNERNFDKFQLSYLIIEKTLKKDQFNEMEKKLLLI